MLSKDKLETLHDFCQSEGWHIFEELLKDQEKALDTLMNIKDDRDLYQSQGQIFHIRQCLNVPEMVKAALEQEDENPA